jgi:hypothetical protein
LRAEIGKDFPSEELDRFQRIRAERRAEAQVARARFGQRLEPSDDFLRPADDADAEHPLVDE